MYEILYSKKTHPIRTGIVKPATGTADIVKNIASAFRTFSLYPEDHALTLNSLKRITSELSRYTDTYNSLVLSVEKDGIYTGGQNIFSGLGDEDAFLTPLQRDGIVRLDFIQGIQGSEIKSLFQILKKNRTLSDEAESDTVTDLWQTSLPHIRYQASELFWDTEPVFSFPAPAAKVNDHAFMNAMIKPSGKSGENTQSRTGGWPEYEQSFYKPANLDSPLFAGMDLSLHPEELTRIDSMVRDEEENLHDDDILDLLLFVLDDIHSQEDLTNVLSNLAEEFGRILNRGEVYKAYSIIEKVTGYQTKNAWMHPFIEDKVNDFIKHLSGTVFTNSRKGLIPLFNQNNPGDIFFLRKICMALDSAAVVSLCEIHTQLESQASRDLLMDIIKNKARADAELIDKMISSQDKMIVFIAISLLKKVKDSNSDYLLHNALKHPVEQVRSTALDYFLEKPVTVLPSIFFLIDDPSMDVRIKLFKFIGSKRAVSSETLMMNYLNDSMVAATDRNHLLTCYRLLGKCCSDRSIPFLRKKILGGAWTGLVGAKHVVHREGALLALTELGSIEAMKLLKKASKSMSPLVRKAYKMVME